MARAHLLAVLLCTVSLWAQSVTIKEAAGWLESAFVEWQPVNGATSYNVYVTGGGLSNQKLDNQLIRKYATYFRADAIGLKAGSYTLKIAPVTGGSEGAATTTSALTVLAHDRSGFAFANSRVPGAYKADGTPKDGAVVVYVSENNKNTISMNVTGATANPCVGLQKILDGFMKGKDSRPLIIRLIGQVTDPSYLLDGDLVIENGNLATSYITLEGVGKDAVANGWGVRIKNAVNIEVRNLGLMNTDGKERDNIGLQQNNQYIWIHHNDLFYGMPGSAADQFKGDGTLDCKKSTYVTLSYNHFWENGKASLLGLSETPSPDLRVTYHHNWFDHSDSRHPRIRFYTVHVYNNYFDGISKYGVGSAEGSSVFVEGNYYRNCKYPMLISMQGSDVWDELAQKNDYVDMGTFSEEDGGMIKAYNNYMTGQKRFVPYGNTSYSNSNIDFDAYVVTTKSATVPSTVKSAYGANVYNNFDTNPSIMYSYTADSPEDAKTKVMAYAGRVSGGDLKWTFNNLVDDTASGLNTGLKAALTSYKPSLLAIQGEGTIIVTSSVAIMSSSSSNGSSPSTSSGSTQSDFVHNFTISGITSSFYTITGALSTSKGSVTYAGLTLTQCLKMESGSLIRFTLSGAAKLTLVFNSDFAGTVLVDGIAKTVSAGVLTIDLASGAHEVKKGDTSNLFYMSVKSNGTVFLRENGNLKSPLNPIQFDSQTNRVSLMDGYKLMALSVYDSKGILLQKGIREQTLLSRSSHPGFRLLVAQTDRGIFIKSVLVP